MRTRIASILEKLRVGLFAGCFILTTAHLVSGQDTFKGVELGMEVIHSDDVTTSSGTVGWRNETGLIQYQVRATYDRFDVDFVPNTLSAGILQARDVNQDRTGIDFSVTQPLSERLEATVSASLVEGFSDYRAVWISEYYRQLFSRFEEYEDPDPGSYGASLAVQWEAVPQNVFIDLTIGGAQERISPGYERIIGPGGGLEKDEELLNAWYGTLGIEHYLSARHRVRHEFAASTVTGRDTRISYRGQLNWAIAAEWVSRSEFSYLSEGSEFYAWSAGTGIERDWGERWFAGLTLRYYKDNGQLENALFTVTSAAPPLESYRLTATVRYVGERFSALLYAGPYITEYGDPGDDIAPFANLYEDRDWVHGGLRISIPF
ncbi:MAG: hypothetical protein ACP5I4_09455 [Oceanipulchritudo sp.]